MKKKIMFFLAYVLMSFNLLAQSTSIKLDSLDKIVTGSNLPPTQSGTSISHFDYESFAAYGVIVLGTAIMGLLIVLFAKKVEKLGADELTRIILLPIIIFASLFLIAAGWNSNQTAPAFGLLGAIAGYLFGRSSSKSD